MLAGAEFFTLSRSDSQRFLLPVAHDRDGGLLADGQIAGQAHEERQLFLMADVYRRGAQAHEQIARA